VFSGVAVSFELKESQRSTEHKHVYASNKGHIFLIVLVCYHRNLL
jgi:hypothetical protein